MKNVIFFLNYLQKISDSEDIFLLPEYLPLRIHSLLHSSSFMKLLRETLKLDYEIAKPHSISTNLHDWCYYKLDFKKDWSQRFANTRKYPPFDPMPPEERIAINLNNIDLQQAIKNILNNLETKNLKETKIQLNVSKHALCHKDKFHETKEGGIAYYCLKKLFQNPSLAIQYEELKKQFKCESGDKSIYDSCRNINNKLKQKLGLKEDILVTQNLTVRLSDMYKNRVEIIEQQ